MTFRVLLVGLGQMSMGYDLESDDANSVQTHARAFSRHPDFELVGGIDVNDERCALFLKHYGGYVSGDLALSLSIIQPDVVVIALPTNDHCQAVQTILQHGPRSLILCEKPLSFDRAEATAMVERCRQQNSDLYVNYPRRVEPSVIEVKSRLSDGRITKPIKGVAWYTKGLLHNGSHFVNLLEFWLGPIQDFSIIAAGHALENGDVEPDVRIKFSSGTVDLLAADGKNFSHHEIHLVASNGCLRYERGGQMIAWHPAVQDQNFGGYTVLSSTRNEIRSETQKLQWHVASSVSACLKGATSYLCRGEDALITLESLLDMKAAL